MRDHHSENKSSLDIPPLEIIDLDKTDISDINNIPVRKTATDKKRTSDRKQPLSKNQNPKTNPDDNKAPLKGISVPDEFDDGEEFDDEGESFLDKYIFRVNWHVILLLVVVISIIFIVYRFSTWGIRVTPNYDPNDINTELEVESKDNILPNLYEDPNIAEDGVTTVVAFGNSPFTDEKNSEDSLASMIEEISGAVVYDCSVTGSYLTAEESVFDSSKAPMDAFSFYWLTTLACVDASKNIENAISTMGDAAPAEARNVYDTLLNLDFNTVDVITIMYDASDYLDGRPLGTLEAPTDITSYYGNLNAGIELLQNTYPHIRIIVMSPTYAYAINGNGEYVSSDLYLYADDPLSTYAMIMERSASTYSVSFVDHFYGTVNELNADEYLTDNMHLNPDGRKKVAERFVYAMEYYDD